MQEKKTEVFRPVHNLLHNLFHSKIDAEAVYNKVYKDRNKNGPWV